MLPTPVRDPSAQHVLKGCYKFTHQVLSVELQLKPDCHVVRKLTPQCITSHVVCIGDAAQAWLACLMQTVNVSAHMLSALVQQVIESTGVVVTPYMEYPQLLGMLLHMLNEGSPHARTEVLKVPTSLSHLTATVKAGVASVHHAMLAPCLAG